MLVKDVRRKPYTSLYHYKWQRLYYRQAIEAPHPHIDRFNNISYDIKSSYRPEDIRLFTNNRLAAFFRFEEVIVVDHHVNFKA